MKGKGNEYFASRLSDLLRPLPEVCILIFDFSFEWNSIFIGIGLGVREK
jgi:hypothetical protein